MPQRIVNIEEKIILLNRTIGYVTTDIKCKETGIFTKHQKNLKEKYYKYYCTLEFRRTVLKHNPLCYIRKTQVP